MDQDRTAPPEDAGGASPRPDGPSATGSAPVALRRSAVVAGALLAIMVGVCAISVERATRRLADEHLSTAREALDAKAALRISMAALADWLARRDPEAQRNRARIWDREIAPSLVSLRSLTWASDRSVARADLDALVQTLDELRGSQQRVEELADTDGNEPAARVVRVELPTALDAALDDVERLAARGAEIFAGSRGPRLVRHGAHLQLALVAAAAQLRRHAADGERRSAAEARAAFERARDTFEPIDALVKRLPASERALWAKVREDVEALSELGDQVVQMRTSEHWNRARRLFGSETAALAARAEAVLETIARAERGAARREAARAQRLVRAGALAALALMLVGFGSAAHGSSFARRAGATGAHDASENAPASVASGTDADAAAAEAGPAGPAVAAAESPAQGLDRAATPAARDALFARGLEPCLRGPVEGVHAACTALLEPAAGDGERNDDARLRAGALAAATRLRERFDDLSFWSRGRRAGGAGGSRAAAGERAEPWFERSVDRLRARADAVGAEFEARWLGTAPATLACDGDAATLALERLCDHALACAGDAGVQLSVGGIEHGAGAEGASLRVELTIQERGPAPEPMPGTHPAATPLGVARRRLEALGLELDEAVLPGQGRCWAFELPVRPAPYLAATGPHGRLLLLGSDAARLGRAFETGGFGVDEAETRADALERIATALEAGLRYDAIALASAALGPADLRECIAELRDADAGTLIVLELVEGRSADADVDLAAPRDELVVLLTAALEKPD